MNARISVAAATVASLLWAPASFAAPDNVQFDLVVSPGAATCLPAATGHVSIQPGSPADIMNVAVFNLPKKTTFNVFVIQVPNAPFGLSWYQGDVTTDSTGYGVGTFIGRLDNETFIVAPGVAAAPQTKPTDAANNPATPPVQLYHLGLWFDKPAAAVKAGCAATVTPFNGSHDAGIQVLNTANFDDAQGPLLFVK